MDEQNLGWEYFIVQVECYTQVGNSIVHQTRNYFLSAKLWSKTSQFFNLNKKLAHASAITQKISEIR